MKILYLTNLAAPYRVDFFNELSKYCDLTVLFERKQAKNRNDNWYMNNFKFKYRFLNSISIGNESSFSLEVIKYLKKDYDLIVLGGYSTFTSMIAAIYLKIKKVKYILNVDGGFVKINEGILIRKIKEFFISLPSFWLSSGEHTSQYLIYYGALQLRIYKFRFTSLKKENILQEPVNKEIKLRLRKELKIPYERVILSVGQIIERKGFDVLIKECGNLKNTGIYIVGGKENEELRKIRKEFSIKNINYIDFLSNQELQKYYCAADMFVLLTREDIWGLVINEALAKGLPVISTNKCGAALELINDKNGLIVDLQDGDNRKKIESFLETVDEEVQLNALNSIRDYTMNKMVEDHMDAFNEIYKILKNE